MYASYLYKPDDTISDHIGVVAEFIQEKDLYNVLKNNKYTLLISHVFDSSFSTQSKDYYIVIL